MKDDEFATGMTDGEYYRRARRTRRPLTDEWQDTTLRRRSARDDYTGALHDD